MKELSTDLDREQREINDPAFTLYTQRSLSIAVGIGFFLSLGILFLTLTFSDEIDAFARTKTGLITFIVLSWLPCILWIYWKYKKMIQEK